MLLVAEENIAIAHERIFVKAVGVMQYSVHIRTSLVILKSLGCLRVRYTDREISTFDRRCTCIAGCQRICDEFKLLKLHRWCL